MSEIISLLHVLSKCIVLLEVSGNASRLLHVLGQGIHLLHILDERTCLPQAIHKDLLSTLSLLSLRIRQLTLDHILYEGIGSLIWALIVQFSDISSLLADLEAISLREWTRLTVVRYVVGLFVAEFSQWRRSSRVFDEFFGNAKLVGSGRKIGDSGLRRSEVIFERLFFSFPVNVEGVFVEEKGTGPQTEAGREKKFGEKFHVQIITPGE